MIYFNNNNTDNKLLGVLPNTLIFFPPKNTFSRNDKRIDFFQSIKRKNDDGFYEIDEMTNKINTTLEH